MKKVMIVILAMMPLFLWGRSISDVSRSGSWYYMYDENGKKYKSLSVSSVGEVLGWCGTFFVAQSGSWIYLYDAEGRKYKSLSRTSVGEVIAVSGNTFTARLGSWIYTYDANGKKINTRSAR